MEAPTSWYIDENGKVVIPTGCTPCCGLPDGEHYFDCPADLGRELAREREEEAWYGLGSDRDPVDSYEVDVPVELTYVADGLGGWVAGDHGPAVRS